jgi:FMN phosphatase YigB (HAD superfamily)
MIKIISFDVWNTLISPNPEYAFYRTKYLSEELNLPYDTIENSYYKVKKMADDMIEKNYHVSDKLAYNLFLTDLGKQEYNWKYLRDDVELIFEEYSPLTSSKISKSLNKLQNKEIKLSIASNTVFTRGEVLNRVMFDHWGIDWSFKVYSDQINNSKPNKLFWNSVANRAYLINDTEPKDILHIGDNKITDGSCVKYGIKFQYNKNPNTLVDTLENLNYE